MHYLTFQIAKDIYALPLQEVERVIPAVRTKAIPRAPAGVEGMMNLHGSPVPIIDLGTLTGNPPAAPRLATRIILMVFQGRGDNPRRLIGLKAEKVVRTLEVADSEWVDSPVTSSGAPYLGSVCTVEGQVIQRIQGMKLLPTDLLARLYEDTPKEPDERA